MKAHYGDIGIINIIRQRLKDIELQRLLSEINNDTRKDANQGNKMMLTHYKLHIKLLLKCTRILLCALAQIQFFLHETTKI